MCDEGKDRYGDGGAENILPEIGAAGQISLRYSAAKGWVFDECVCYLT